MGAVAYLEELSGNLQILAQRWQRGTISGFGSKSGLKEGQLSPCISSTLWGSVSVDPKNSINVLSDLIVGDAPRIGDFYHEICLFA